MDCSWHDKLRYMLITDRRIAQLPLIQVVEAALSAGFTAVQLRERDLGAVELYELGKELREVTRKYEALLLINDRVDVALAVDADGVQLGWRSLPTPIVRQISNAELLIGVTAHNVVEMRDALRVHADFALFGPVYPTPSKEGLVNPVGVETLKRMAVPSPIPVLGLGGINAGNVADVFAARASGAAVIRAIMEGENPYDAAQAFIAAGNAAAVVQRAPRMT